MQTKLLLAAAGAVGALALGFGATPAFADQGDFLGGCALTDIDPNAAACNGYYEGNVLGGDPDSVQIQTDALAALGLVWDGTVLESVDFDTSTLDFDTLLSGATYIGIHWGKGQGPVDTEGGGTGFYRLDLADDAELDVITVAFGSQSGARLFFTTPCEGDCGGGGNEIPEPATWTMMILGFGGVGAMMRRRRYALAI